MAVIALLGSGEFEPWARPVDAWCAERATAPSDRVLVVPTAAAPEGDDVFDRWVRMGSEHYRALGLSPEALPVRVREDAFRPEVVDLIGDSRLIFFSGGNPGYLAETLIDTPLWEAIVDAVANGTALGGCSAGATALGVVAPFVTSSTATRDIRWVSGLPFLTRAYIPTHFDALDSFQPGLRRWALDARPAGSVLFGLDENTAAYGDGEGWTVCGSGALTVTDGDTTDARLLEYRDGRRVSVSLGLTLPLRS